MKKDMNDPSVIKSLIKYDMAYCFNSTCPRADECFRHQAYAYKDPAQKVGRTIFPDALQTDNASISCGRESLLLRGDFHKCTAK